jgi:hypothetical protein
MLRGLLDLKDTIRAGLRETVIASLLHFTIIIFIFNFVLFVDCFSFRSVMVSSFHSEKRERKSSSQIYLQGMRETSPIDLLPHPKTPTGRSHQNKIILDLELEDSEDDLSNLSDNSIMEQFASNSNKILHHSSSIPTTSSNESTAHASRVDRFKTSQEKWSFFELLADTSDTELRTVGNPAYLGLLEKANDWKARYIAVMQENRLLKAR